MSLPLKICCWRWGTKYNDTYVRRWSDGLHRHVKQPHELLVFTPQQEDVYLTEFPGCFCRLRMFDPAWQERAKLAKNERLVCTDLDVIFTGQLDPLFDRKETFVILAGANAVNPCPYNGSLMMLRGGHHHEVWQTFSVPAAKKTKFFEFPDDQGFLWDKLPSAATWQVGQTSGVYAFQKPGWPGNDQLPDGAKMVVFPGWRDPAKFSNINWIREKWN